jgi:putative membrane-bound dehydrogenase-like protein
MKRVTYTVLVLLFAISWLASADGPPADMHHVKLNGHTFTLPAGFEIELAAAPPLVNRPIVADFDEEGRLYVADSSGSNEPVQQQLQKKPHRIVRLADTQGKGVFDKSIVYADQMMFPEGVMWYAGSLYVAAPPSIWKLTDTKGEGVADQRVEWFQGKTLTGCANDLHGPYLGPDGWIYWCKGAFARQTYDRPGKAPFSTKAAHIFRCRPDGSGLEAVMTGGMDNPVDVVFTPGGERIFTTTFFQHPGGGLRDGLIHAVYGGVYGKDHDPIYEHKWSGPTLMPVLTHMGPAAPCGLVRYESDKFGPQYKDNLFACQFNMHKVSRHILTPSGATFTSQDSDFLVSDNLDFHPTDVIEDADGSLLICDTGGWYKLCCPTSQLVKPDVLGAIYRVRRTDAKPIEDPRGKKIDWANSTYEDLFKLLGDRRPAVQNRTIETIATRARQSRADGEVASLCIQLGVAIIQAEDEAKRNGIWTLCRINHAEARSAVRSAMLTAANPSVKQCALHSISLWRDAGAKDYLLSELQSPDLQNRRAAAEALGRIGNKSAVPALLEALGETDDRVLQHSLNYALIEIADRPSTSVGLKSDNRRIRRAAMIALDQMDNGGVDPKFVAAELNSTDPAMKETASWIVGRHSEWGDALAGILRERMAIKELSAPEREELIRQLAKLAKAPAVQQLLAESARNDKLALRAMAQSGLKQVPDSWIGSLTKLLADARGELLREAINTARALPIAKPKAEKLNAELLRIGNDEGANDELRLLALTAAPGGLSELTPALQSFVTEHLNPEQPVVTRALAADVLARSHLKLEQLVTLTDVFKTISPTEVDRVLDAFGQSTDETVCLKLIAALQASPVRGSLRAATIKPRLAKFGAKVEKQAQDLYSMLNVDEAKMRAHLDELFAKISGGDIRRGQQVFHSQKASCFACHAIGYRGGDIGPDLTRIGSIRNERDLLESIVYPSASFVRGYEPMLIATKNGRVLSGLIKKDTPEEILLVTGANQQERIPRDSIEAMQPGKVSVMPSGLEQQLSQQDLSDLIAFLKACK